MNIELERYISEYKYGRPVIVPSGKEDHFDRFGVDCPTLFRHNGKVYLMHIGFDGDRYQTALCVAEDETLLKWRSLGVILSGGKEGNWDQVGRAGTCILCDNEMFGSREIMKINGKYWLFYHSYPQKGYETGPAEIGLAWTEDEELLDWHCLEEPVYSWRDGEDWEHGGLYKCYVILHEGQYYMYYNAKNITEGHWFEQTGAAVSDDMLHWSRVPGNPCVPVGKGTWDEDFASDPVVMRDGERNLWVMYYFGFDRKHAQEGIAFSEDLIHWEKHPDPILKAGAAGEIDCTHAHKPGVLWHNGALYHFYCACRPTVGEEKKLLGGEYRTISVARSVPWE